MQLVRRTFDLFNRREIDHALDATREDFEADYSNSIGPARGVYRGRQQVRELESELGSLSSRRGARCAGTQRRSLSWMRPE